VAALSLSHWRERLSIVTLDQQQDVMKNLQPLYDAVLTGDAKAAKTITAEALAEGADPMSLVTGYMVPAMAEVGRRFESGDFFVPELLVAARAMKASLELIRPLLAASGAQPVGRVVLGTVQGDLHDIGKNLVGAMLEGGGYEVVDLGVNVPPSKFIAAIKEKKANIVAMSALLTTTMPAMKTAIDAIAGAGIRSQVKILVGGAPISQQYADQIGADGYTESAAGVVGLAQRVCVA
jgi:corrinoid protein of di/trimethylamine methyltransferase